mmetsp:Transcript_15443/g.26128  ORF Transcript_15443/g.26128 Transcript_15443/m.26128 type:complete len:268 (+) Transcript_15443:840-1643(+)
MTAFLSLCVIFFVILILKQLVLDPIVELSDKILHPQSQKDIEKFVAEIQKNERKRQKRKSRRQKKALPQEEGQEEQETESEVNEVQEIRFLFSQLFKQNTAIQTELEAQKALSKKELQKIMKKFKHSQFKKDNVIQQVLKYRQVMMIEEDFGVNLQTFESQLEYAHVSEQLSSAFERLMFQERVSEPCLFYRKRESAVLPRNLKLLGQQRQALKQVRGSLEGVKEDSDWGEGPDEHSKFLSSVMEYPGEETFFQTTVKKNWTRPIVQ